MTAIEISFTDEQTALRDGVRSFLADVKAEIARSRDRHGADPAKRTWRRITSELELTGLPIAADLGGSEASWVEVCLTVEEMGRVLYAGPYFSTVCLATSLLLAADSAASSTLLGQIAAGAITATTVFTPAFGLGGPPLDLRITGDEWLISGETGPVIDGATADVVLAAVIVDDAVRVIAFNRAQDGVVVEEMRPFDLGRPVATLMLNTVRCRPICDHGMQRAALDSALARSQVALSCEQVGGMQTCLDMAVGYAKERVQFGRPIGSFQAIKHKCADMVVRVDCARALAYEAAVALSADLTPSTKALVNATKVFCTDAYMQCAADNIQIHGAIAFTWEHDAHRFYRRAIATNALLGSPDQHRSQLADYLLD